DIAMALYSEVSPLPEFETCDLEKPLVALPKIVHSEDMHGRISPTIASVNTTSRPLRGEHLTRLAALLIFCDPLPEQCLRMLPLSRKQWEELLHWLDINGLALYFLNRIVDLELCDLLPPPVFTRLTLNLIDNTQRTRSMISESIAIQQRFQNAALTYANLKGLSLCPSSVPKPELRSQFDLDFLVAEEGGQEARRIRGGGGYPST